MGYREPHAVAMGSAIRGVIAQAGLSQAEAARQIELSINSFSRRVNGELPFTWPEVVRVAAITGTSAAELAATADRIANRDAA